MQKIIVKLQQVKQKAINAKHRKEVQKEELNSKIQYLDKIAQTHRLSLIKNIGNRINEILRVIFEKNTYYKMLIREDAQEILKATISEIRINNLDTKSIVKKYKKETYKRIFYIIFTAVVAVILLLYSYLVSSSSSSYNTYDTYYLMPLLGGPIIIVIILLIYFRRERDLLNYWLGFVRLLDVLPGLASIDLSNIGSIGSKIDDFYRYLEKYGLNSIGICKEISKNQYDVLDVFNDFRDLRRLCRDYISIKGEDYVSVVLKYVDERLYREYSEVKPVYDGIRKELDVLDRVIVFLDRFIGGVERDVAGDYSGASTSYKGLSKALREDGVLVEGLGDYSYVSPDSVGGVEKASRALEYVARLNVALAVGDPVKIETELSILSEFVEDLIDSSTTDNVYADLVFEKLRRARSLS